MIEMIWLSSASEEAWKTARWCLVSPTKTNQTFVTVMLHLCFVNDIGDPRSIVSEVSHKERRGVGRSSSAINLVLLLTTLIDY